MTVIGLTGGTGSGKTEACSIFEKCGVPCLDTDTVSREVCGRGSPCLRELTEAFGDGILNPDGTLDRRALAGLAFGDDGKTGLLNRITHHYILARCREFIEASREKGAEAVIINAPLLYESGFDRECDLVIGVVADTDERIQRVMSRDGMTEEQVKVRMERQHTDEFFIENCDIILYNSGSDRQKLTQDVKLICEGFEISD